MEFQEEVIKEAGLTEDQITKISPVIDEYIATKKQEWDGKANTDAEAILEGAANKVKELTGINREQGQKIADYIGLAGESYAKGVKSSYEQKEKELEEKIKNADGDPLLKKELEENKAKLDALQQKSAQFKDWEENDYKGKLEEATKELGILRLGTAYSKVKPAFPDTVNKYESEGRWKEFKARTNNEWDVKEDGTVINKENPHLKSTLKELIKKDAELMALTEGRKVDGINSNPKVKTKIEGVPFEVADGASPEERRTAIKDYLTGELKLSITSKEYSDKYSEYNKIILEKNPSKK